MGGRRPYPFARGNWHFLHQLNYNRQAEVWYPNSSRVQGYTTDLVGGNNRIEKNRSTHRPIGLSHGAVAMVLRPTEHVIRLISKRERFTCDINNRDRLWSQAARSGWSGLSAFSPISTARR